MSRAKRSLRALLRVRGAGGLPRGHAAPPRLREEVRLPVALGRGAVSFRTSTSLLGRQGELVMY